MSNDERDNWAVHNVGRIILTLILTAFFVFVTSLTVFQTHLLIHNLTTCKTSGFSVNQNFRRGKIELE